MYTHTTTRTYDGDDDEQDWRMVNNENPCFDCYKSLYSRATILHASYYWYQQQLRLDLDGLGNHRLDVSH